MRKKWISFLGLALASTVSGCSTGGVVTNPIGRTFNWFSYVGGEDIRERCLPGTIDALRFVYNGRYIEQLRTYDITEDTVGPGAIFRARAIDRANLLSFNLLDPLAPWRGQVYQNLLSTEELGRINGALLASGFDRPSPKGLYLRSDAFYWTVSACRHGQFHFYAWQAPQDDLARLPFIAVLLELDQTGTQFNPPREVTLPPFDYTSQAGNTRFQLEVGDNGLVQGF